MTLNPGMFHYIIIAVCVTVAAATAFLMNCALCRMKIDERDRADFVLERAEQGSSLQYISSYVQLRWS